MKSKSSLPEPLTLNIVPLTLSKKKLQVGILPYTNDDSYRKLREEYWQTHAFRYDNRIEKIINVAIKPGHLPLGNEAEFDTEEHLLLVAKAIQRCILTRIASSNLLLRDGKKLLFLGQADQSLLLKQALEEVGASPVAGLEVAVRYEIDCRLFWDPQDEPYLALVIDVGTSNIINIPVSDLLKRNFPIAGKYVCRRGDYDHPYLHPRLEALGMVSSVSGDSLLLSETEGENTR